MERHGGVVVPFTLNPGMPDRDLPIAAELRSGGDQKRYWQIGQDVGHHERP
jgi:hypothetical protein